MTAFTAIARAVRIVFYVLMVFAVSISGFSTVVTFNLGLTLWWVLLGTATAILACGALSFGNLRKPLW